MPIAAPMSGVVALGLVVCVVAARQDPDVEPSPLATADGYRGIWYSNQATGDEHRYKYAGGFATYPQQHVPIAYYSAEAGKTFFTYGGVGDDGSLLHMVSYFDHGTGELPRPVVLLDKETGDAHDNPTLMLDGDGHVWVFSNSHGTARPAYVHRSLKPHSIDRFERVLTTNFSYSQPWFVPGEGWCFLHTRYSGGRLLYCWRSEDGREWGEPTLLANIEKGHYQVSWRQGKKVGTAFNVHPADGGLNARTNLYYMETTDGGRTFRAAGGGVLELPLVDRDNPALVRDYASDGRLVYLKDVQFDADGRPVILYMTSGGYEPGPANDPRTWTTARWSGEDWVVRPVTHSDHNYDFGSLYVESDGTWRVVAPTDPGPQPYATGGEMVMWTSTDRGATWKRVRSLTAESTRNHTYARRPVNADPRFYSLWADGDGRERSESALYFADLDGRTWRMPTKMEESSEAPVRVE